jgi:hypothetical protein
VSLEQLLEGFKAASRVFSTGSSSYRGIYWDKQNKKWRARIKIAGCSRFLGHFKNEEDAAHAYDRAVLAKDGRHAQPLYYCCLPC